MKYFSRVSVFLLLLVLAAGAQNAGAQGQWRRATSANFDLIGNSSDRDIRRVATTLEQFREVFVRLFPTLRYDSPVPTRVIVFRNERAFRPYKPLTAEGKPTDWVAGYFRQAEDANYIVLTTERERQQTYQLIYHEYVHYIINNSFGRSQIPPWFNEGLAEYYDQFMIQGDIKVVLGSPNENHIMTLRNSKLIPLEQFFKIDYYTLHQQGKHGANIFYAQAWAMMHYLINGREGSRSQEVDRFLQGIRSGQPHEAAFKAAFQMSFADMERELRRYVNQSTFRIFNYTLKEKLTFEDAITSQPVADHVAKTVLGDLMIAARRFDDAEAHLKEALAEDISSPNANASMGMVMLHRGKFDEARKYLDIARRSESSNHLVHYRYAYLLSREGMDANGWISQYSDDTAETIRSSLERAIKLNPDFPESHRLYAFVNLVRDEHIDEGITHIRRAIALSPGNEYYQLELANLLIRKEEFQRARAIAEAINRSAEEGAVRSRAQAVLKNVDIFEANRESIRAMREARERLDDPPVITEADAPPLSEEKLEELRAKADLMMINRSLRTPQDAEIRILGDLTGITCGRDNSITYAVKFDGGELRLTSKDFHGLYVSTFVPTEDMSIGCGTIKKPARAVLTYLSEPDVKTRTSGRLISIELVPENFEFLEVEDSPTSGDLK
ncbi:MAG TPA: DUF1570 domain-containing protein [Pyrinomonadaceae bacterium]|nr:DUF1570 domain-containing protein [Pyrinomonadaceae bacterium]HMP65603.1 DUF1570 domain-containing protein [Pyrinomonadaceae bacterium]